MEYISSDTNVWIDFVTINKLSLPFKLDCIYLMEENVIKDELLSPKGIKDNLLKYGLSSTELSEEEYWLVEKLNAIYAKPSLYDCIALAIAKNRNITLLTGDKALRKAALKEGVKVIGTLGLLDRLLNENKINEKEYLYCLNKFKEMNNSRIRLPESAINERIKRYK